MPFPLVPLVESLGKYSDVNVSLSIIVCIMLMLLAVLFLIANLIFGSASASREIALYGFGLMIAALLTTVFGVIYMIIPTSIVLLLFLGSVIKKNIEVIFKKK